MIKLSLFMYHL